MTGITTSTGILIGPSSIVVGTAGHIDHGKTSLVKALSGMDTDRLAEEKRRGISIEVGFANFRTPTGRQIALVDVPGHERFVRNMLAGVSGIDLVLLIVAADESVKPQTREHFDICRLLGIERGVVVITKVDLVDDDIAGLVELEVGDLVRGSFLEGAAMCRVSAMTGEGLPGLIAEIDRVGAEVGRAGRSGVAGRRAPRLPIDRSFSVKGHGTVVTGTLREGVLAIESEMQLYPTANRVRVRGIEVHGHPVRAAEPGLRTAVNLGGPDAGGAERGQVLSVPGLYEPVRIFDARVEMLAEAKPLKDRAPVHFHSGTLEAEGEVRLLGEGRQLPAAGIGFVRVVLREPALLLPGDRFILRSFSPVRTMAGGIVADLHFGGGRLKRKGEAARLVGWMAMSVVEKSEVLVAARKWGMAAREVCVRLAIDAEANSSRLLATKDAWLITRQNLDALEAALAERVKRHHKEKPLEAGLSREAARSEVMSEAPASLLELLLEGAKTVVGEGEVLRLRSHQVRLSGEDDAAAARMESAFQSSGLAAPGVDEVLQQSGLPLSQAKAVLALLLKRGRIVRVSADLICHREALESLKALMGAKRGARFSVPEFKDWTGVSRKFSIPLLEYLDREKVSRREGDQRVVL